MASQQEKTFNNISNEEEHRHQGQEATTISPEEIGPYRATAQQNSIDAIKAAEDRYAKAKESGTTAFQQTKEAVVHGVGAGTNYLAGKGYQAADYTVEKGKQGYEYAKETAITAAQKSAELAKQAAVKAKDVTVSSGETAWNYATGKTGEVKEAALGADGREEETGGVKEKLGERAEEDKNKVSESLFGEKEKEEGKGGVKRGGEAGL
ncbi:hypothetical protein M5K25_003472 [Dendrobium thyrsiflorum]|uniref:Seed biotin-containing protein SBP65 n=1 Tax=Dendrobium thyrsiflorum TaxID=117978 RepID=A0ABD0VRJ3_DENTH